MKMVSQLTRRAMSRHRITAMAHPAPPAVSPAPETVRSLYAPLQPSVPAEPPRPALFPEPPARQTIYGQLMRSHDRMRERHLRHT